LQQQKKVHICITRVEIHLYLEHIIHLAHMNNLVSFFTCTFYFPVYS